MLKAIILVGGPAKGTRFRPLSLDIPKPLFPVAGFPMIYHHIEACSKVADMKEIILIGSYQLDHSDKLSRFLADLQQQFQIIIRYLQEYKALGTGGGIYHFRDQILSGNPEGFFVMNCDVCCDFPLNDMLVFHRSKGDNGHHTIMATEATRQQAVTYGCIVENKETNQVLHYVEKPETFVSSTINCGVYLLSPQIFEPIKQEFKQTEISFDVDSYSKPSEVIRLEQDIFARHLAGSGNFFVYHTTKFWSQIKSSGAAIYANRQYLKLYHTTHPDLLAVNGDDCANIIGDVFIHKTASVHPTAKIGPNVTVGKNVVIGEGVRIKEAIILDGANIQSHSCILHSIIGWNSSVGSWTRIEGTPNDPNPNKPFAKIDIPSMFSAEGKLNPSITVIGSNVQVPSEVIVLNSIVLPHKELGHSFKNQVIL